MALAQEPLTPAERKQLEAELEQVLAEIKQQSRLLIDKREERVSLERDVAILDAEIKQAQLSIRARDIQIQQLNTQISGKQEVIVNLNEKLVREKESLAQLIRKTNEIDDYSLAEVVLSQERLSDFFEDLGSFTQIKEGLQLSFQEIEVTKDDTETQKLSLQDRKSEESRLRLLQQLEKEKIEEKQDEKEQLLATTRGQEQSYQAVLAAKERTAGEIRARLFNLRDSTAIPFEKAVEYANSAAKATGVRPALLLAVLRQETNLGSNVGTCNRPGDPPEKHWREIMPGQTDIDAGLSRRDDESAYLRIVGGLGLNPEGTPLSCPYGNGWGGAMGPAQFIPTTWELYQDRLGEATGQKPPNPWDPRTAFTASALLLADNGADKQTYESERLAALRYYAGWGGASNPANSFYGDSVMRYAADYQRDIDIIGGN